jgi:hypothetical protein
LGDRPWDVDVGDDGLVAQ